MKKLLLISMVSICMFALFGCEKEADEGILKVSNAYSKSLSITLAYCDTYGRYIELDKYELYPDDVVTKKLPVGKYLLVGTRDKSIFDMYYRSYEFTLTENGQKFIFD